MNNKLCNQQQTKKKTRIRTRTEEPAHVDRKLLIIIFHDIYVKICIQKKQLKRLKGRLYTWSYFLTCPALIKWLSHLRTFRVCVCACHKTTAAATKECNLFICLYCCCCCCSFMYLCWLKTIKRRKYVKIPLQITHVVVDEPKYLLILLLCLCLLGI